MSWWLNVVLYFLVLCFNFLFFSPRHFYLAMFCFIFENLSLNRFRSLKSFHYSGFSHTFINIVFSTDACTFCNISCSGKVIDKVVFKLLLQMLYKSHLSLENASF